MIATSLPTYFLSHGGGPWPWLDGPFRRGFDMLEASLKDMRRELGEAPCAVLMVSGHWEETRFTLSSGDRPGMVYDYSGFPPETYRIRYAAPGSPVLAETAASLLRAAGLDAGTDAIRGYDHGTFSLMKVLYPEETMPLVQLSLRVDMDPAAHLAAGRALAPLRAEGVLIVGSGLSYHNLAQLRGTAGYEASRRFDAWLQETLIATSPSDREAKLIDWARAPAARAAHPHEDHLVPLLVAVGAAGSSPAALTYHQKDFAGGITASSFRFGEAPTIQPIEKAFACPTPISPPSST